jgi:transposase-like protein
MIRVGALHESLQQRRREQQSPEFKLRMQQRNAVEGTISELVRAHGLRRARYRGFARVDLQNQLIAAACNIKRWLRRLSQEASQPAPEAHLARPQLLRCPLKAFSSILRRLSARLTLSGLLSLSSA